LNVVQCTEQLNKIIKLFNQYTSVAVYQKQKNKIIYITVATSNNKKIF